MPEESTETIQPLPRVVDTYALVYAFVLLFLVPGAALLARLPFGDDRSGTYSFTYVSLVTLPFVFGLVTAFLAENRDGMRAGLIRAAVLTPLVVISGVAVMFTSALAIVPVSGFIRPENFGVITPIAVGLLIAVASPLLVALVRKIRDLRGAIDWVQTIVIAAAVALVATVAYLTLTSAGAVGTAARKDTVIYVIGALTWYLPSFGLAAGIWRRVGLV